MTGVLRTLMRGGIFACAIAAMCFAALPPGTGVVTGAQAEMLQGYVNADQDPPLKDIVVAVWHLYAETRDAVGYYQVLSVNDGGGVTLTSDTPTLGEFDKAEKKAPQWYLKATKGCVAQIILARTLIVTGGKLAERARRMSGEESRPLIEEANKLFQQAANIIQDVWPCIKVYAFTPFIPGPTVSLAPFPGPSSSSGGNQPSPRPSSPRPSSPRPSSPQPSSPRPSSPRPSSPQPPSPRPSPSRRPSPSPSPSPTPPCGVRNALSRFGGAIYVIGDPSHQAKLSQMLDSMSLNRVGSDLLSSLQTLHANNRNIYVCLIYKKEGGKSHSFKTIAGTGSAQDSDDSWIRGSVRGNHPVYIDTFNLFIIPTGLSLRSIEPTAAQAPSRGTGVASTIYFDPDIFPVNSRKTPGHVGLAHELIHAFHLGKGIFDATPLNPITQTVLAFCYHDWEELETIGSEHGVVTFTENAYRLSMPWPTRACHNKLFF